MFFNVSFRRISFVSVSHGQDIEYSKFGMETNNSNLPHGLKAGQGTILLGISEGKTGGTEKTSRTGPVILFFYRGKWCPICSRYLNNYQDSLKCLLIRV